MIDRDLKGKPVIVGTFPGVGTIVVINEKRFRVVHTDRSEKFGFTMKLQHIPDNVEIKEKPIIVSPYG